MDHRRFGGVKVDPQGGGGRISVQFDIKSAMKGVSMKVAIIGSGISGLACGHYLHRQCDITVFEASRRPGGHTATVDVALGGRKFAVDTGFIVYNDWTYPNFIALMDELGVSRKTTDMSFSMSDAATGLEYAGSNLNTLFAQRRNLVSPRFLGMLKDITRFNREAVADLDQGRIEAATTLGDYLVSRRYGAAFRDYYLIPMGAAIWSADAAVMLDFPLQFFIRFFNNHGLLSVRDRPQWRVIEGGSREYLKPLMAGFAEKVRSNCAVVGLHRLPEGGGVELMLAGGGSEQFDQVVLACHSDQALALLQDPSQAEAEVLAAIPYQANDVVLHTDVRMLPRNRRAWSSWNYQRGEGQQRATLTYNMNILQGLKAPETFCVTLNNTDAINPHKILGRFSYDHPVFTVEGMRAQARWSEISGGCTWYCGAYWRNGFHEDGVVSAQRVARGLLASAAVGAVNAPESVVSAA
jgi:predicted NAD/FAD-binding protein